MSIYDSNIDNPNFYRKVENVLLQSNYDFSTICEDFNLVLYFSKDNEFSKRFCCYQRKKKKNRYGIDHIDFDNCRKKYTDRRYN